MQKFTKFYISNFEFDYKNLQAKFRYNFDNEVFFEEILDFNNEWFNIREDIDLVVLDNLLFHLHIALWISYYKSFPTNDLIVESWFLDNFQLSYWKKFYENWLWEFLYTNNILPKWLFNFVNNSKIKYKKKDYKTSNKSIVAIWWWKDSIVTIELLKKWWTDFDLVVIWKIDELKQYTSDISKKKILQIKRQLSLNIFELNSKWYYNWHVPITWLIAFILEVTTYLYDYKYIILSNEKSANFWNVFWKWLNINHQYSKSLDFEKDFSLYVNKYISSEVKYFSLLRWMYEVKIAKLFSEYWKQYFNKFSSCNNNFKINSKINFSLFQRKRPEGSTLGISLQGEGLEKSSYWCNNCPKCAFVFSILRPYLTEKEVIDIFWEDLYMRKDLEKLFRELLGLSGIKPFECVWESEEVIYSMYLTLSKYTYNLPFILKIFQEEILPKINNQEFENIEKKLVTIYNDDIIPLDLKKIIFMNI